MNATWKTVRIFISSTFRDMQAERDHLVRFVFPKLRQELLQRRIHLVDVDLRWGVTSEQDALSVCREVVDECRPRFLCMLGGRYGWVPPGKTRSITADEVHYGVLDRDLASRGFAYFYFRDPSSTAAMVEVTPGEFREPAGSPGAADLAELKMAITMAGLQPFIYRANKWDDQSRRLMGLKEFGDRVYADLKQSIDKEFGPVAAEKPDAFTEENAAMDAFIEQRVQRFVLGSRQRIWDELLQHAQGTGGNGYLCLTGEAGSGKSALLGKFCQDYRAAHPEDLVIPHFVGASPGSTDVRRTLRRLCHELVSGAGLTAEIPEDPEKLRVAFGEILQQASVRKRIVIVLDAINQFDSASALVSWSWLPEELPATARIILSTLSGPALESLQQRRQPPRPLELQPLDAQDREAITREFLHRYRKSMTDDQRGALLAKADAGTPLYLLVALEELRTLGTYEEITDRVAQLPPDTRALFIWILKRLEDDDGFRDSAGRKAGEELVSRFVSLLGASRHGLSQQELVELLSPGDPQGNVAALTQLLRPYLMQRGELLDFYHGQFREAAGQAYLQANDRKRKAHTELAEYFQAQCYWFESTRAQRQRADQMPPTPRPANARKVDELPWQLLQAAKLSDADDPLSSHWDGVAALFTDLRFMEAKAEAAMIFDLVRDSSTVIEAMPTAHPRQHIVKLIGEAIGRDSEFIDRHPTTLFQCLWNACWWYDCPEASDHYDPPLGEWPAEGAPWTAAGPKLYIEAERWERQKNQATADFLWFRSIRPPSVPLNQSLRSVRHITPPPHALAVSPDGCRLAIVSPEALVILDPFSSATKQEVRISLRMPVADLSQPQRGERQGSIDDTTRLSKGESGEWRTSAVRCPECLWFDKNSIATLDAISDQVRIWDVRSVALTMVLSLDADATLPWSGLTSLKYGRLLAASRVSPLEFIWNHSRTQAIPAGLEDSATPPSLTCVWSSATGQPTALIRPGRACSAVSLSRDGKLFAIAWDRTMVVYDIDECLRRADRICGASTVLDGPMDIDLSGAKVLFRGELKRAEIASLCFLNDARRMAVVEPFGRVELYDVFSGERCWVSPTENSYSKSDMAGICPADDDTFVASIWRKRVHLLHVKDGTLRSTLSGARSAIQAAVVAGGSACIAALTDSELLIWDSTVRESPYFLKGTGDPGFALFKPDTGQLVSESANTMIWWDVKTGRILREETREPSLWLQEIIGEYDGRMVVITTSEQPPVLLEGIELIEGRFEQKDEAVLIREVSLHVGWLPHIRLFTSHPDGNMIAGSIGNDVCLYQLVGA